MAKRGPKHRVIPWHAEAEWLRVEEKLTLKEIARRFGVSAMRVKQVLNARGVSTGWTTEMSLKQSRKRSTPVTIKCKTCSKPVTYPRASPQPSLYCSVKCRRVGRNKVHGMAMGLREERRARALELYRLGWTYNAIAAELGVSLSTACVYLSCMAGKRIGWKATGLVRSSEINARARESMRLFTSGMTVAEVAKQLMVSPSTVRNDISRIRGALP